MKTKRRVGTAASTGLPRDPRFPKRKPWSGKMTPAPPRLGPAALQSRQPLPSAALRQVRILDDELDILVGELRDPHGRLVGIRHRAPPLSRPPASAVYCACANAATGSRSARPCRFGGEALRAPPAARRPKVFSTPAPFSKGHQVQPFGGRFGKTCTRA